MVRYRLDIIAAGTPREGLYSQIFLLRFLGGELFPNLVIVERLAIVLDDLTTLNTWNNIYLIKYIQK